MSRDLSAIEDPQHLGLVACPPESLPVDLLSQVEESPRHGSTGNSLDLGDIGISKRLAGVADDPAHPAKAPRRRGHIGDRPSVRPEPE
jgi:hypothetical protein